MDMYLVVPVFFGDYPELSRNTFPDGFEKNACTLC